MPSHLQPRSRRPHKAWGVGLIAVSAPIMSMSLILPSPAAAIGFLSVPLLCVAGALLLAASASER